MGRSGAKRTRLERRGPVTAALLTLRGLQSSGFAASRARTRVLEQLDPDETVAVARLLARAGEQASATRLLADLVLRENVAAVPPYQPGSVAGPPLRSLGIEIDAPAAHYRELFDELLPSVSPFLTDNGTLRGHLASIFQEHDRSAEATQAACRLLTGTPIEQALRDEAAATAAANAACREREFEWLAERFELAGLASGTTALSALWRRAASLVPERANRQPNAEAVLLRLRAARSDECVVAAFAAALDC